MMNAPIEVQDDRYIEIAKMLVARRRDLLNDLKDRKRDARAVAKLMRAHILGAGQSLVHFLTEYRASQRAHAAAR